MAAEELSVLTEPGSTLILQHSQCKLRKKVSQQQRQMQELQRIVESGVESSASEVHWKRPSISPAISPPPVRPFTIKREPQVKRGNLESIVMRTSLKKGNEQWYKYLRTVSNILLVCE